MMGTCSSWFMLEEETVAVLVVPVSWVSQGGLEQTRVTVTSTHDNVRTEAEASHGVGLPVWRRQLGVPVAAAVSPASPPAVVVVVLVVLPGSSEVGDAMMETGRSWTRGWASAPLGVVIRVTCRQSQSVTTELHAYHCVTRVTLSVQCYQSLCYLLVLLQSYSVTMKLVLP